MSIIEGKGKDMTNPRSALGYNPAELPRELAPYYISATDKELTEMLEVVGAKTFDNLFDHIPENIKFKETPKVCERLEYDALITHMNEIAAKNNPKTSFIGDGLASYRVQSLVPFVCNDRGLTTAYTPYQPERSQGTLTTLWLYSSSLSMLTGFEAINASFYDRATCLFEAAMTATRLVRGSDTILLASTLFPSDIEVVQTLAEGTKLKVELIKLNEKTGTIDLKYLKKKIESLGSNLAGIAFPQVNNLGKIEAVNELTDLCHENKLQSIAVIDPMLLATEGLLPPCDYGTTGDGANMLVGEGQHLAIAPNFGGPGLGIFGIRFNPKNKNAIRSTAGRYIGKTVDAEGKEALTMVLSTREQHIRREKATSNICSNQSFLATAAGAGILARGEKGMTKAALTGQKLAIQMCPLLTAFTEVSLAYPESYSFNDLLLEFTRPVSEVLELANNNEIHLGIDVSSRTKNKNVLLISFTDIHKSSDLDKLIQFFNNTFTSDDSSQKLPLLNEQQLRKSKVGLPNFSEDELRNLYTSLGKQNVSPDDNIYPLGSCTMKYNPYINDYAASLTGFTDLHPQAPESDAQGCLEILFETQEFFKGITGLPAVTTQPVAGAQGELVGLKMFQAYHESNGNKDKKDIILIPKSAHGTNPATATMAGYDKIVTIDANEKAQINFKQLEEIVTEYGGRIAGIMVTNPNTSGIFETQFKEMADLIHSVDGLVYMDGANMNAIASWVNLGAMGVDAVHNNLHKTWTIPHGGGGPGDAIVAVSEKLIDFMPGIQVSKTEGIFSTFKPSKSIGSFHRHFGNFAHKVRAYTYIKALGDEGIKRMSAVAVLSAKYLYAKLKDDYPTLPASAVDEPRMHEFILTISDKNFKDIEAAGVIKNQALAKIGKLFLDFGLHAPTVAFPEQFGLMIEPTESFTKAELDRFLEVLRSIYQMIEETPEVLRSAPHFTPVNKVDEVAANKKLVLWEPIIKIPEVLANKIEPGQLNTMTVNEIRTEITTAAIIKNQ